MDFYVYSRQTIEAIKPHEVDHLIISIRTPGDPDDVRLPVNERTKGVWSIRCYDRDCPPEFEMKELRKGEPDPEGFFTEHMGGLLLGWVILKCRRNPTVERIIIHCDGGVSRSPAVAAGLAKTLFEQDDAEFHKRYRPNMRVYRSILNAWSE